MIIKRNFESLQQLLLLLSFYIGTREGVIINQDVVVITPLVKFYLLPLLLLGPLMMGSMSLFFYTVIS